MTNEQAIRILSAETSMAAVEELKYYAGFNADQVIDQIQEAMNMGAEALEKQIPTTVEKDEVDCRGYTDLFICGKCSTYIQTPRLTKICEYNYCPWCGNRLE